VRDQLISLVADADRHRAWLELVGDAEAATAELGEGELLMLIEALAMAYAVVCRARRDSLARGVNRTLRTRPQLWRLGMPSASSVAVSASVRPAADRGPKGARVGDVVVAEGSRWLVLGLDHSRREAICRLLGGSRPQRRFRAGRIARVERGTA
jgi:hypothetical protein